MVDCLAKVRIVCWDVEAIGYYIDGSRREIRDKSLHWKSLRWLHGAKAMVVRSRTYTNETIYRYICRVLSEYSVSCCLIGFHCTHEYMYFYFTW